MRGSTLRRSETVERFGVKGADSRTGSQRFDFADDPSHFFGAGFVQHLLVEHRRTGAQFVQQHAQATDVAACIDVSQIQLSLFGAM